MPTETITRELCDIRTRSIEFKIDALSVLMRKEFDMMVEDRERQRSDLRERLAGMNHLQAKIDEQAKTMTSRDRLDMSEVMFNNQLQVLNEKFAVLDKTTFGHRVEWRTVVWIVGASILGSSAFWGAIAALGGFK